VIRGDRYGAEWVREAFRKVGIEYRPSDLSKSELYRDLLPRLNSGEVDLLDHPRLITQLLGLERRTARGGRDSIDHAANARDDLINAAAGVLVYASSERGRTPQAVFGVYASDGIRILNQHPKRRFDGPILEGDLRGGFATTR
jgi:hypothetical protein